MALNLLRSGYATLEYEIAQEKASALGRLGRRLEAALAALAACPRTATSDRKIVSSNRRDMRFGSLSCNARPAVSTTARK
jgi:plasmid stabilization system protein ParE